MKNIIKTIIALFFILGAFFSGKYFSLEENKSVIKELNKNLSSLEKQISTKENLIKKMKIEITTCKDSLLKMSVKQSIIKALQNSGSNIKLKYKG